MTTMTRRQVSRMLSGCCAVLWLTGSLSVTQGNLTPQWTASHCPSGQTQNGQHSHTHCAWHCGGLDIQGGGGQGILSADTHVSRVWSLGVIPRQDAASDGDFPPRGPPQGARRIA
ncbi:hypothetical protein [Candidatus Nitrospira nitrificans]|uniref:Uncharacterized protein n=1 Tax=Candidatus Nitrospira nitrificans TaxID=1742973 RepID=A0A0S4LGS1_9BACT|nr:hypothetical protein [Candidatus Nitrospira nitrificans]CUS35837.1 exported hypothetical protein [Candidatus Nitrospira nitrificans]